MATVKRARMRTNAAPASSSSSSALAGGASSSTNHHIAGELLTDFCRGFLSHAGANRALLEDSIASKQTDVESFTPAPLMSVPLQFDSSTAYLKTFHRLLAEEATAEFTSSLVPGNAPPLARLGFTFILLEHRTESPNELATRICRLRTKLMLPDRNKTPKKDWKMAEEEQMDPKRPGVDLCQPVRPSSLSRGDVVVLLDKPLRAGGGGKRYATEAKLVALAVVDRPARPVGETKGSGGGGMELDVGVTAHTAQRLHGMELFLYAVPDCNLLTCWREWDGMNSLFNDWSGFHSPLLGQLLGKQQPPQSTSSAAAASSTPPHLPGLTLEFQRMLVGQYNASQYEAITAAASQKQGFVLVQGPPGTGKTHTLYGILNALHLSVCHLSYDNLLPQRGGTTPLAPFDEKQRFNWLADASNPHLLICAPSNAAIDNVMRLVTERGFKDGNGNVYRPTCVRIGSSSWNRTASSSSNSNNNNSLDGMVDDLMQQRRAWNEAADRELEGLAQRLRGVEAEIRRQGKQLWDLAIKLDSGVVTTTTTSREEGDEGEEVSEAAYHKLAGEWFGQRNRARDLALDLERRRLLIGLKQTTNTNTTTTNNASEHAIRMDMRALVLTQANLVFATLSQCGSPAICEIAPKRVRFQACVIDEAAQCVEPSVLVPLSLGVERCIMVGDPNQLPATVLSELASKHKYEQSLFERLQLGNSATGGNNQVHLLDTQYRCRPEMSSFSSKTFYNSQLKDGANVVLPEYRLPAVPFGPLMFFDVGFGTQKRPGHGSFSFVNEDEARVCLELYQAIRQREAAAAAGAGAHVAVISPYKDQLVLLQRVFGGQKNGGGKLEFNTVDGFQGREVDVVIFSCVRSKDDDDDGGGGGGGIGFLADARRLNVAVTRAKYNLFLVGNYAVLKRSALWRKLLDHVKQHGRSVPMRHVRDFYD